MSSENEQIEQTVLSVLGFFETTFIEESTRKLGVNINEIKFILTTSVQRFGVSGSLLISDVDYEAYSHGNLIGTLKKKVAMKFMEESDNAIMELNNSFLLENSFLSFPEFGTPKIIFSSTKEPVLLVYEGIDGKNYDETFDVPDKAYLAGKLLSIIHGSEIKPVDDTMYQNFARMLGQQLTETGYEQKISEGLGRAFLKIKDMPSGCNAFSDFHQSNVMIQKTEATGEFKRMHVIDPEFMQEGNFDRMEDVGTFFGGQFFQEFQSTGSISNSIADFLHFIKGYSEVFERLTKKRISDVYSMGIPIDFSIALWALTDALDFILNREGNGDFNHPDVISRMKFAVIILNSSEMERASKFWMH